MPLLVLILGACRPWSPRGASPEPAPTRGTSRAPSASEGLSLSRDPPAAAYPAPQGGEAGGEDEHLPGRPTLPAELPASGPVAPALDLAAVAAEPFLLAWVDDRGLWLYEEGAAEPRQLAAGKGLRRPLLDPSRRAIVWQAVDPAHSDNPALWSLWAMPLDGEPADARQILTPADLPEARGWNGLPCPRWLRDIQWLAGEASVLAFATSAVGECGGHAQRDLWKMALGEPEPQRLLEKEVAHFRPSPDGSKIAIAEPGNYYGQPPEAAWISLLDLESGALQRLLAYSQYSTESDYWLYPDLLWVDGGQAVLVAIEPAELDDRYWAGAWQAFDAVPAIRLGIDGSRSRFAEIAGAGISRWARRRSRSVFVSWLAVQTPSWSADLSSLLLLERSRPGEAAPDEKGGADLAIDRARLLLAKADGSNPEPYTSLDDLGFLGWAPSAPRFLYDDASTGRPSRRLFVGEPGQAARLIYEAHAEDERIGLARWAGDGHVALLREGLPTPPLLEIRGLDGSSRGLAQSVGIELDILP